MIIVSIASANNPVRLKFLIDTLTSLDRQTVKPSKIYVSLEGYLYVPPELKHFSSIAFSFKSFFSGGLSSYLPFKGIDDSYCISLDDDLLFPDTFIGTVIRQLESVDKNTCISYLSKYFTDISSIMRYDNYEPTHFSAFSNCYKPCHILGSGISAFYSDQINNCYKFISSQAIPGMFRDILVSYYLWLRGVRIVRPPCLLNFIKGRECSFNCNDKKLLIDRIKYFNKVCEGGFLDKTKFGSLKGT